MKTEELTKYDIIFIVVAAITLISINEFLVEDLFGGITFTFVIISYFAGRYVEKKISCNIEQSIQES